MMPVILVSIVRDGFPYHQFPGNHGESCELDSSPTPAVCVSVVWAFFIVFLAPNILSMI